MDNKHLHTLEFSQILGRLARHSSFSAGKELALALRPSPVLAEVQQRLQETREARHLLDTQGGVSLGGAHDIRSLARNAQRGAVLPPMAPRGGVPPPSGLCPQHGVSLGFGSVVANSCERDTGSWTQALVSQFWGEDVAADCVGTAISASLR